MNTIFKGLIVFLFVLGIFQITFAAEEALTINSPNYFSEQNNIYDLIHFLENEHLSFSFCGDVNAEDVNAKIYCTENSFTNLPIFEDSEKEGCYFSNFDLNQIACSEFRLQIDYNIDNKQRKEIRELKKQKQSKLINHVIGKDYSSLNDLDLSYYLIVLNDLETQNSKLSEEAYDELKNNRNNDNKCWPSNKCDLKTTSQILKNIKIAGYDLKSRLLEDGRNYLEKSIISNENNPLKFQITIDDDYDSFEEVECELSIDDESTRKYFFNANESFITKEASNEIGFVCNETVNEIEFKLYNLNDNVQENENFEDTNSFSYTIEDFACLGSGGKCDFEVSLNAITIYQNEIENSKEIENYIETMIVEDDGDEYVGSTNIEEDSGKYLYYNFRELVGDYLKFNQNNDGSWGINSKYDRIIRTSWAILGLQTKLSDSEYVEDGKKWIYYSEPISGWGNVEKNSMAYLAIKEQIKPYLKITPINEIKDVTQISIENPTIYKLKDLKLILSDNINQYVSYSQDLGSLEGEEITTLNISLTNDFYGKETGTLTITGVDGKNSNLELVQIPINLQGPMPFSIETEQVSISEDFPTINLKLISNLPSFESNCSYINPFNQEEGKININQNMENVEIPNPSLTAGIFDISFDCSYNDVNFNIDVNEINVSVAEKSFEVAKSEIIIENENDIAFSLTNTFDEKQIISLEVEGGFSGILTPTENEKIIAKDDTRELFLEITNPVLLEALGNTTKGNLLIKGENGYVKKIPIKSTLGMISSENNEGFGIYWIIGIITFLAIIIIIIRYIRINKYNKEQAAQSQNQNDELMFDDIDFD